MKYIKRLRSHWLIPLIAIGMALSTMISGRDLESDWFLFEHIENRVGSGMIWLPTVFTLVTVVVAFFSVVFNTRDKNALLRNTTNINEGNFSFEISGVKTVPVGDNCSANNLDSSFLLFFFTSYFIANYVVNSAFGTVPSFNHQFFYSWLVFFAVYVNRYDSIEVFVKAAKLALLGLIGLSLILLPLWPSLVIQHEYTESILGLKSRLWGLGSHPNSIGPLALTFLLLEYYRPYPVVWLHRASLIAGLSVFVLAQSKTVWLAGVFIIFVLTWFKHTEHLTSKGRWGFLLFSMLLGGVIVSIVYVLYEFGMSREGISPIFDENLSTFSGRDQIWVVAIETWLANPITGYGPTIWDEDFKMAIGMPFAFHAHNQLLQALSSAGILGAIAVVAYLAVLCAYSFRARNKTKGVSVALFLIILFRFTSEIPLSLNIITSGEILMHLVCFRFALLGNDSIRRDAANRVSHFTTFNSSN